MNDASLNDEYLLSQAHIGASDLVPEVNKHHDLKANAVHLIAFVSGLALLLVAKMAIPA